jgi:hypothetical protein
LANWLHGHHGLHFAASWSFGENSLQQRGFSNLPNVSMGAAGMMHAIAGVSTEGARLWVAWLWKTACWLTRRSCIDKEMRATGDGLLNDKELHDGCNRDGYETGPQLRWAASLVG